MIKESISQYLDETSFGSTDTIAKILQRSGFNVTELGVYFPRLQKMLHRRHQIVHHADRIGEIKDWAVAPFNPDELMIWTFVVILFINDVVVQLLPPEHQDIAIRVALQNPSIAKLHAIKQYLSRDDDDSNSQTLKVITTP